MFCGKHKPRFLESVRKTDSALSIFGIAIKNLGRRPVRTAAIFLGMAALSGTLFALTVIYMSVGNSIERARARLGADAVVVPANARQETESILLSGMPSEFYMEAEVADGLKEIKGVSGTASQLFIVSAPLSCCTVSDTMLIGFDPENDFTISPWLRERLREKLADNEVIVGANILSEPGGRIRFYGKEFLIAGKLEPTGMKFIDSSVFIPIEGARRMIADSAEEALRTLKVGPDEISAVLLRLEEGVSYEEVAIRVEHSLPDVRVILPNEVLREAKQNLATPVKSVLTASVIQWAISLFMIGVIYSLSVEERKKEIGLLRAMGAKKQDVRHIFFYEILFLSGGGGLAGIFSGIVLVLSFQNLIKVFFGVPFLLLPSVQLFMLAVMTLLLTLASGILVTLYPIFRESKSPLDIVQRGGMGNAW